MIARHPPSGAYPANLCARAPHVNNCENIFWQFIGRRQHKERQSQEQRERIGHVVLR